MNATDFEKAWGIPPQRIRPLVGDSTADLAVIARIGGRAITLNRPDVTEADLLYVEHASGSHTRDFYVEGCPTCDPPETVIERYQREGRLSRATGLSIHRCIASAVPRFGRISLTA